MRESAESRDAAEEVVSDIRALRSDVEARLREGERDFSERDLDGALLAGTELSGTDFQRASLIQADFSRAELVEANLEAADLRQAQFSDANLTGANFKRAGANESNFSNARLSKAHLTGARLERATFAGAELAGTDFSEALAAGADFSRARARGANFARTNLRGADLRGADLQGADFRGADLRGANLEDADLSFVELGDAELSGADFSRTNLAGARVGGAELPYAADHRNVESLGDQDRALLFTLMGLCAYVIVSVGTTSDAQLALNRALLKLPILDVELPLQSFFVGAALVVFGTAYYLSLEQARMIKALSALPRVFPDSSGLAERAHPWLVVVAFSTWFGRERRAVVRDADTPRPKTEIGTWLLLVSVFALNWGLAPFTVGMLLFRFLASQRADQSYFLWALFAASIVLSFTSFLYARRASGATSGRGVLVASVLLGLFLLTTLPGVLMGLHDFHLSAPRAELSSIDGDKVSGADLEKATLMRADFRMARLDQALLRRARLDGALLGSASLAGAHAEFATFEGADLSTADLTRTVFWNGNLARADLTQARATHADLRRADLRAARAARADFSNALGEATRFDGAYLSETRFVQLRAPHANFEGADLDGADLSGAVLSSANLRATHLRGTRFDGSDVTMVDFTGSDLNVFQLCSANGWRTALLPGDEAPDDTRPFRITQAGPLRLHAESLCPESVRTAP